VWQLLLKIGNETVNFRPANELRHRFIKLWQVIRDFSSLFVHLRKFGPNAFR